MKRDGTRMRRTWVVVAALALCAAPAFAQIGTNIIIVGFANPDAFSTDLQEGIQEAVRLSRSGTGRVLVLAHSDASPYGPISIPADANIEVRGVHVAPPADTENRNPASIVVRGILGDGAAITIHTATSPDFVPGDESDFLGDPVDQLVIDGVAATGGINGVLIDNGAGASVDPLMPLLNRLYIHENFGGGGFGGNGIRAVGAAEPFVINCSIWGNGDRTANDEGAGISIGVGGNLFALHDTILLNENYGIHFEAAGTGTVRNTIVYRNGDEEEQSVVAKDGGIVWDMDPFIDPNFGPVTGGPAITIFGDFVGTSGVTNFDVYFGPTDMATAIPASGGAGSLTVTLPAAYNGVPGPVDVHVVRADGYEVRVPIAFNYINAAGDAPIVSQVLPEWGDEIGGNYVFVLGAGFERDCDVFFDFDGGLDTDPNEMSDKVTYLSPGELLVKVPDASAVIGVPTKVEVFVTNNLTGGTGETSLATLPRDYEYRPFGVVLERPSIVSITPNYFRDVEGTVLTGDPVTSNILVWNLDGFPPDPVVKIGDLVVPYNSTGVVQAGFIPQPNLESEGGTLYEIFDVEIPVSEFGAGGTYDVTVINANGLNDTLNGGFTYYADGIPRPDPTGRVWRPANFVETGVGGARTLLGSGYDTTIALTITETFFGFPAIGTSPYRSHTQRAVEFGWPANTVTFMGVSIGSPSGYAVEVDNVSDANGDFSVGTTVQATDFHYLTPSTVFDIHNLRVLVGSTMDAIVATIRNYDTLAGLGAIFSVYVNDVDVGALTHLAAADDMYFNVPIPGTGVAGPVDIRVQTRNNLTPGSDPFYYIAEGGYSYRRAEPQAHGVFPRTIAVDTTIQPSPVRVRGTDFTGPFTGPLIGFIGPGTTPYTRVFLDDGDDMFNGADLDISRFAAAYEVYSYSQIDFTVDLTAHIGTLPPLGNPVSIHLDTIDPISGVRLAGPTTLLDALIIENTPPEITDVQLVSDATRRDGPVRGGTPVRILGHNFDSGGVDPIVRIGGKQAEFVSFTNNTNPTPDEILIVTPPAPDLLAGTYPVVVIRPADQSQGISPPDKDFTYFLDGAPEILEIVPNHIPFPTAGDSDPRYITILGLNFSDIVQVVFDSGGSNEQTLDHYAVSPTEIVVKVPLGADANAILSSPPAGQVTIPVIVRNVPTDATTVVAGTDESNPENIFIFDDDRGMAPNVAVLEFNNVFLNSNDYVMVQPGQGSISIDPLFDPRNAPDDPGLPGPKLLTLTPTVDPWVGKLAIRDPGQGIGSTGNSESENPMRDKGGEFTFFPFTALDFEQDDRPDFAHSGEEIQGTGPATGAQTNDDGLPDIGADEIVTVAADSFGWYLAQPFPNPVPALDVDDLSILVGFRPASLLADPFDNLGTAADQYDTTFFIVPQGMTPAFNDRATDRLIMTATQDLGGGLYIVSNTTEPVQTIRPGGDFGMPGPTIGDWIMDGHAAIYVRPNPAASPFDSTFILGDDPFDLSDGDTIIEQAVLGRHFLIDTIPPKVNLRSATYTNPVTLTPAMESLEVVEAFNDFDAADVTDSSPLLHPTQTVVANQFTFNPFLVDGTRWYPAVMPNPLDQNQTDTVTTDFGLVYPPSAGASSTSIFLNAFSESNDPGMPLPQLQIGVVLELYDPHILDVSTGFFLIGPDFFSPNIDARQVSGFDSNFGGAPAAPGDVNVLNGPVRWDVIRGANLLLDTLPVPAQISNEFLVAGGNPGVFNFANEPDESFEPSIVDRMNDEVTARWGGVGGAATPIVFEDPIDHLDAALMGNFNLSVQFDATDLAGNESSDDPFNDLLNPVNLYWYREVNSEIVGIPPNLPTSNPVPTFQLDRGSDPNPAPDGGPAPIYSYRVYFSDAYQGEYFPVPDPATMLDTTWQPWDTDTTINDLPTLLAAVPDSWILLIVHGADEAGNVELWNAPVPSNSLPLDMRPGVGDALHNFELGPEAPNWIRFGFSGTAPPDTRVRANFWHDDKGNNTLGPTVLNPPVDSNLGNITIVPMPGREAVTNKRVVAQFFVGVDVPPNLGGAMIEVRWEFFEDGVLIDQNAQPLNTPQETIEVKIPAFDTQVGLGDQSLRDDITYVFRATAGIAGGPLGAIDDPSPASVLFTVVPLNTQTFVAQALDPDRQPIVILEEQ